jgi:N-ethylmaleimide reductase
MNKLFSAVKVGPYTLSHRVAMAPLTRMRSEPGDVPGDLMVEYYTQRATEGGLIVTEATPVSVQGYGYAMAPGIYSDDQIAGWRRITDAVHAKGARIFLQLWHVGRQSHPDLQPGGAAPVAPSALKAEGHAYSVNGEVEFTMPRALELHEIPAIVEDFRRGAERALRAGFDGVELHGANGYLPDQFLQDGSNARTDEYGGPIENRARFLLEVTDALISVWGADRVGVRIAPSGTYGSMHDSDPETTFGYVTEQLDKRGIGYLHVVEPRVKGTETIGEVNRCRRLHERDCGRDHRSGPRGHRRVWPPLHRQPRSARAPAVESAAQPVRPEYFLWRRRTRLHRLPVPCRNAGGVILQPTIGIRKSGFRYLTPFTQARPERRSDPR